MKIRITESGIVESVQTYSINNRTISLNIEIDKWVKGKTQRWKVKSKIVVNVILMNILACLHKDHRLYYSRQNNKRVKNRYNIRGINNLDIMNALDKLEDMGYLVNHIAHRQYGRVEDKMSSWIEPSPKFIAEFVTGTELLQKADRAFIAAWMPIVMRDEDKQPVDYRADEYTFAIEQVVTRMNDVNGRYTFLDHNGKEFTNLYSRIFNNESWEQGGRNYKAAVLNIENKESKNRLRIKINGESVVEVDYTALHLFIVAEEMGIADELGEDPYARITGIDRGVVKLAVNTMFNCTSRLQAVRALNSDLRDLGYTEYTGSEIVATVFKAYPKLKEHFCSDKCTGLRLQNLDSWMTQYVTNVMSTLGKPVLPVHDSNIVRMQDRDLLIELMSKAYRHVLKKKPDEGTVHLKENYFQDGVLVKNDVSC